MTSLKRIMSFLFFVIVLFISGKHLGQGAISSQTIPLLMGIISLVGIVNAVNPLVLGNITNSHMKLPNKWLVIFSLGLLMMTGDLSKLIGLAESKVSTRSSVIKEVADEKVEIATNNTKVDVPKLVKPKVKDVADMTPEELVARKENYMKGWS